MRSNGAFQEEPQHTGWEGVPGCLGGVESCRSAGRWEFSHGKNWGQLLFLLCTAWPGLSVEVPNLKIHTNLLSIIESPHFSPAMERCRALHEVG